jgi:alpha-L-fucosidase
MKSLKECLQTLILCAGGDGNLLFNVGPMPDGRIEPRQVERLEQMGQWLAKYGKTIYGTRGGPWMPTRSLAATRKQNKVFLHLFDYHGGTVSLPNLPVAIARYSALTGGKATVRQEGDRLTVSVSPAATNAIDTIVQLDLAGSALGLAPIPTRPAVKASASNVYQGAPEHGPEMAVDEDPETRWATDSGTHQAWLAVDFGKPVTFQNVRIQEAYAGRVMKFEFQVRAGAEWKTVFSGTRLGENFTQALAPLTAREVRLNILDATEGPTISEVHLE